MKTERTTSEKQLFIREKEREARLNTFMAVRDFAVKSIDPPEYMPPDHMNTFEAVFAVKSIFRCIRNNPRDYEEACRRAERQLMHKMYEDILPTLHAAQNAAHSGDREKTIELILTAIKTATYGE